MIVAISSFVISLLLLMFFLGYQIIRLRKGEVASVHDFSHDFIPRPHELNRHINPIKKNMIEYGKRYGHEIVLWVMRSWIRTVYFIKKEKEVILPKIKALIPKRHHDMKQPAAVSEFLQSISKYKNRLKKIKEQIKEEEKQNF